ncbi:MAG: hypothetical protein ABIX01_22685 [Chitinophagaceae bacterium]
MRQLFKLIAPVILLIVTATYGYGQKSGVQGLLTADSLASGNFKDLLTSFFQLSFNNLTGPKKELNFASNPFAVLLKSNPSAAIDTNYIKYKQLRKINFGFGLKLDSSYKFNGFSSSVKYALINNRDTTTSRLLFRELGNDSLSIEINALHDGLNKYIQDSFPNTPANFDKRKELVLLVNKLFTDTLVAFNKLDGNFQQIVKAVAVRSQLARFTSLITVSPAANIKRESEVNFRDLKNELKKKLLWTVSLSDTTFKDQFFFSNILLKTELLKGMGKVKAGSNTEMNLQAAVNFVDDTTSKGRDLKRAVLASEFGFNWVIRNKGNDQSYLELKFSGAYQHIFQTLYQNEKRNLFTLNGTFRVRVINDIWLPLEFKYDPATGNILGFLSVKFNFNTIGKFNTGK